MAGPQALATAALYLVLKSNGLHRPENLPVKFGFSPKSTSTNIAKKLPLQRCFKPLLIALFNFSHKRPTFAFTSESGTHSALGERSHTTAHTAKHGAFRMGGGITTLGPFRTFTNIPGPGIRTAYFAALGAWSGVLPTNAGSLGTAMRLCVSLFRGIAAPLGCVICLQLGDVAVFSLCAQYFRNVRGGGGITTLGAFHTFRKPCVAGV